MKATSSHIPSVWKSLWKKKSVRLAAGFLGMMSLLALLGPLLANDLPLYAKWKGRSWYPAFEATSIDSVYNENRGKFRKFRIEQIDWRKEELEEVIWAPIAYGAKNIRSHRLLSPFGKQEVRVGGQTQALSLRFRHWLGTDHDGFDLLAGIILGSRISLLVGVLAVFLAVVIGVTLGALAGYFGNTGLRISRGEGSMLLIALPLIWFYGFHLRRFVLQDATDEGGWQLFAAISTSLLIGGIILVGAFFVGKLISRFSFFSVQIPLPVDSIISRIIEILNSIPILLLIIAVAAVFNRSIWLVMTMIGLTSWPAFARLIRAEMLSVSQQEFVSAAKALGFRPLRILFRHALPNTLTPLWVAIALAIGGAIMIESSLSFLNLIDMDEPSWGKMLRSVKSYMDAWWIAIFPGLTIFLTVLSFNLLGEKLREVLNPTAS